MQSVECEAPESFLAAPFPWFGGKATVADLVWSRFGRVKNYVEPFFGSGAVLLRRPSWTFPADAMAVETVNDMDAHLANFWRAVRQNPEATARAADRLVSELDLHAIGDALFCGPSQRWPMTPSEWSSWLREDESHFDCERAGAWAWFVSNWIGGLPSIGNQTMHQNEEGVSRRRPHLGNAGVGVSRQLPHLGNAGMGVGECERRLNVLRQWFALLADRLRNVRVCCGDWSRVCGPTVTVNHGLTAVFLDPPYSADAKRDNRLYSHESGTVAHEVRDWCLEAGKDRKNMRIALCGYDGEGHDKALLVAGWDCVAWKAHGGYGNQGNIAGRKNAGRERIWFSPGCLKPERTLFD